MEYSSSRVLFITHEDSHTGAPIAVLGLLKILHAEYGSHPDVCVLHGKSALESEYRKYAAKVWVNPPLTRSRRVANRLLGRDRSYERLVRAVRSYDIVVMSSVVSLQHFSYKDLKSFPRLALCIFEMPVAAEVYLREDRVKFKAVNLFYSPSPLLSESLAANPAVAAPIVPLNQYIDAEAIVSQRSGSSPDAREPRPFVAGMIGAPGWPKGVDYFFCIAKTFCLTYPDTDVRFVWKGMQSDPRLFDIYRSDVEKAGIADKVVFQGRTAAVADYYEGIDLLALSSREDTYPNVMIEAALFRKPTICFRQSGGAEYFVDSYGGKTVPFLDIPAFCRAIHEYATDPALLAAHGQAADRFAREQHASRPLILRQFLAGIARLGG